MQQFVEGHVAAAGQEHRKAQGHWAELQERFPGANHLMLEQAKVGGFGFGFRFWFGSKSAL
jgi:hypothetical protein